MLQLNRAHASITVTGRRRLIRVKHIVGLSKEVSFHLYAAISKRSVWKFRATITDVTEDFDARIRWMDGI